MLCTNLPTRRRFSSTRALIRASSGLGLPGPQRPKRRRSPRQLKLFEKATSGESVQVDVKVVKVAGAKTYQYTPITTVPGSGSCACTGA